MKLLGIDYGEKRVGIAISDEEQKFAIPKEVIPNNKELVSKIKKICLENEVENIVIGDSRDYRNQPNAIMDKIVPFVEELRLATGLRIEMEPEFMTSFAAERFQGKHDMLDASAAALILQSFLDKKNNS